MATNTPRVAKRVREAGFTEPQAEAVTAPVQEATQGAEFAAQAAIAALRSELRQSEPRLEAKIEALRSDIRGCEGRHRDCESRHLEPYLRIILGTLVVNIIAVVGAMFAVAKLSGH